MLMNVLLVFFGGFLGALARFGIVHAVPAAVAPFPLATGIINVAGAFLLGLLTTGLLCAAINPRQRARWKAFLGSGFLGGFTTYSALAVDSVLLTQAGHSAISTGYAVFSIGIGTVAAWAGLQIGARSHYLRSANSSQGSSFCAPLSAQSASSQTDCVHSATSSEHRTIGSAHGTIGSAHNALAMKRAGKQTAKQPEKRAERKGR
ncbi:MAG: CrcB family protein [Arcanobacterium sp.]|nr:CrcB family protein [Arcanobacterium sp.]